MSTPQIYTTIPLVLQELLFRMNSKFPDMAYVYDESLSYESAVSKLRADNRMNDESKKSVPLWVFKRSPLGYPKDGIGRRSVSQRSKIPSVDNQKLEILRLFHGEMDIEFLHIASRISDSETFEITYLAEEGLSESKQLFVKFPQNIGTFQYTVEFNPLVSKSISRENVHYKSLGGSLKIRGWYLLFKDKTESIKEIRVNIEEFNRNLLSGIIILPK